MSKLSNTNYPLAFLLSFYLVKTIIIYLVFSFFICQSYLRFRINGITILGDYSGKAHLFPFRTEKLSLPAQMVLQLYVGEYVVATFLASIHKMN